MKTINNTELKLIKGKWCLNGKPYTGISKSIGSTYYFKNGKLHRDNGLPSIERASGYKSWYVNGKRHRDNGLPAIEEADGTKEWWVNGNYHRDNGLPAVEWANGDKAWWVNGNKIYSWDEYQKATNCSKEELVMYILTHGDIS